jgi:phosphomannomutase
MVMTETELAAHARAWRDADPDPETRRELNELIERSDFAELKERVGADLEFGTAGLRALVGAGSLRMNRAVIRRTTEAVARYLHAREPGASLPVVVGADARLSSRAFLEDTVGVLVANGIRVRYFPEPVATPIVAFAMRQLCGRAAIVITASHNPKDYNGYKLYAANGAQIISPTDHEIATLISEVGPANTVSIVEGAVAHGHELCEPVSPRVLDSYFACVDVLRPKHGKRRDLRIVYTPMHGVGWAPMERALRNAGFDHVHVVAEQAAPDGRFPTVSFPNPEEAGALDMALALAARENAELILANDPDADRLAASVPTPSGTWRQLSGNQVGLLLADYVLENVASSPRPLVAQSIVSSPMLRSIAEHYGAYFTQTLTGFKWVWNAALELERTEHVRFAFGYEEALGYSIGDLVRDKDGISVAVVLAELAASESANGSSLLERLERLYRRHGLWVSHQKSLVREGSLGLAQIQDAMTRLGAAPPREIDGRPVAQVRDFRSGEAGRPRWLPNTSLIELEFADKSRVLVRPSGTEPKLKLYVDMRVELAPEADVWAREKSALADAEAILNRLIATLGL